jgi:hypothetical protein
VKILISGLAAVALLAAPGPAVAAPVTVNLRVEGPTKTAFEGPVTTDLRTFRFTGDPADHQCDGTAANSGDSPSPVPTRGAAIATASEQAPFSILGTWNDQFGGATFEEVGGESVAFDSASGAFFGEFKNWQPSNYGACGDPIATGDEVLFAYGPFGAPLLQLTGPVRAAPGEAVPVKVVDGATGAPVGGASVAGAATGADGTATVGPLARGETDLKASKDGAIRSNRLRVCVTDGADGFCGTTRPGETTSSTAPPAQEFSVPSTAARPDRTKPHAKLLGIREQQRFRRGRGPRVLRGTVADESPLLAVKLRLTRSKRGKCWTYSSRRERFRRARCGIANGYWFTIGDEAEWSYLLPRRLKRGRYVLDVKAIDRSYNRDEERRRGDNRVVFHVR